MTLKNSILAQLEANRDTYLSGEQLARETGVSRNAVWKAVRSLRRDGYDIISSTNRGYRLEPSCDKLSAEAIARAMAPFDVPVHVFDSLDSTNTRAKLLLSQGEKPPFYVVSDCQTSGRGRRGRAFFSPPGTGVYMSLVIAPRISMEQAASITLFAAACAAETIEEVTGIHCEIKWVNDLFLNGKKVCGILTEAVSELESGFSGGIVIGVGINVRPCPVPDGLEDVVGFLGTEEPVRSRIAGVLLRRLMEYNPEDTGYIKICRERSTVIGRDIRILQGDSETEAHALDIDSDGGLIVRLPDGSIEKLRSGEVSVRMR